MGARRLMAGACSRCDAARHLVGVATALSEIVVGIVAQLILGALIGGEMLGTDESWIQFLAGTGAIVLTVIENSKKHYENVLAPLKAAARQASGIHFKVAVGHPAEQIIRHAEDEYKADLIVMGHRGKNLFERLRLGSVSKQVVHYARCPVTIVR